MEEKNVLIAEVWRDVVGYEGYYQVSNLGYVKNRHGKILKFRPTNRGYYRVSLHKKGEQKEVSVHRLVFEAFNGPIPHKLQVNHINEIKTDNRPENLNLMTAKENINWGTALERSSTKRRNCEKRSKKIIQHIGDEIKIWPSMMEIERQTGFAVANIISCCKGKYKQAYGFKWEYA